MGMVISNGVVCREDFRQGLELFMQAYGPGTDTNWTKEQLLARFKLTQSDLRLEQPVTANNNSYLFPVLSNIPSTNVAGGQFNTEVRLNMQDIFLPQYMGFFLANPSSATDCTFNMFTYVNNIAFPASPAQMQCFYNGAINISVNNTQYIKNWMTRRSYIAPQTQQTGPFGAGSQGYDMQDGGVDGFYPFQPYVLISGNSNMQITVNLPIAPTTVDANSRLVIVLRGILAQNSTATT
jgi:hypothetical protein